MRYILILLAIVVQPAFASEPRIWHCFKSACPLDASDANELVITPIYALSYNKETKFADWVAYQVTSSSIGTSADFLRHWKSDPQLTDKEALIIRDWSGAYAALEYEKGHQAPLAAFSGTEFWRITNLLSNITPQKKQLNERAWKDLEERIRDAAHSLGNLYVITGTLYEKEMPPLPNTRKKHQVPSGYWKVVKRGLRTEGFIMQQNIASDRKACDAVVPISQIEALTNLNLFPSEIKRNERKSLLGC